MPVKERGYRGWEGVLASRRLPWLPIAVQGIRQVKEKKRAKLLFFFSAFPFLFFLIAVYVATKPELKFLDEITRLINDNAQFFDMFFTRSGLIFVMFLLSVYVGSDLISADLKFNSIQLYLSRPLKRADYLAGKLAVVMFYLLMFSLVPALLLVLAKLLFSGSWSLGLPTLGAVLVYPLLASMAMASLMLLFSSFTANTRLAVVGYVGFYFLTNMLAGILSGLVFKHSALGLLSPERTLRHLAAFLFGTKPVMDVPLWTAPLLVVLISLLALGWTLLRIRRVEV
ncbi:MAG: ABC transporter permease subunit [Acidobacteriota bacterium]|nr:ABC transporter permease subunit [Acidobacteriota bacterium]